MRPSSINSSTQAMIDIHHSYDLSPHQCSSRHIKEINSPVQEVWSIIRCFENPQAYKPFIKSCTVDRPGTNLGSTREITVISGLPAKTSMERLDRLDDYNHVMSFTIIGGDHQLKNYRSTISAHEEGVKKTVVIESYVVDVPDGSSKEDTCLFADTIVGCNLKCLAKLVEQKSDINGVV